MRGKISTAGFSYLQKKKKKSEKISYKSDPSLKIVSFTISAQLIGNLGGTKCQGLTNRHHPEIAFTICELELDWLD